MLAVALVTWGLASEPSPASGPSFSLVYAGAQGCPSRANFEAAIFARAPSARLTEDTAQAEVRFEAELAPPRLRVALRDGTSQDREIDADDCAEAVQSMAVIAAMVLSSRQTEPKPLPLAEAPKTARPEAEKPAAPPATAPPAVASTPPKPDRSPPTWLALGGGFGMEGAAAPKPTFAASGFVELGSVRRETLSPSVRLSAVFGQAPEVTTASAGDARFRLLLGRLHGCGLRFGTAQSNLRLCAVAEGGALLARGVHALNGRSQTMGWLGAGLGALGQLQLGAGWALELGAGTRGLFVHDQFVFSPGTVVHQVPVIAWDLHLALAYRVW